MSVISEELIKQINEAKIVSVHHLEDDFPHVEWKSIATLGHDEHRWYVIATEVYKVGGTFIGVSGLVSLKSESMSWSDADVMCEAFEMEEVQSVTYKKKEGA